MKPHFLIIGVLLTVALCISPVSAYFESEFDDVSAFNISTIDGYTMTEIRIDNLEPGQAVYLDLTSYNESYIFQITSTHDYGIWWSWHVDCTYPNGTTLSDSYSTSSLIGDYDIDIQAYWGDINTILSMNLYASLKPLEIVKSDIRPFYTPVAFSNIAGYVSPGDFDNVRVFHVTYEEFEGIWGNDLLQAITGTISTGLSNLFAWSWDMVLGFAAAIPFVGDYLETALILIAIIFGEIAFWFNLIFIEYPDLTFMTIEFYIIADAIMHGRSVPAIIKRIFRTHMKIINFMIDLPERLANLIMTVVKGIANIIQALKPI